MESSLLFANADRSVVLVDIPRTLEEAQVPHGDRPARRIVSSRPLETPWQNGKSRPNQTAAASQSASAKIGDLMSLERVKGALAVVNEQYSGPWCLPRIVASEDELPAVACSKKRKKLASEEDETQKKTTSVPPPYIPADSRHLLGTIESLRETFLETAPSFDLIILDPPWPSRSIKRKRERYETVYGMPHARQLLSQIPVPAKLKPEGLVGVWVTNKAAAIDLLTSPGGVFTEWGLELIGEWIWVKITCSGEPVVDVESQWRKPWERLLVARRKGSQVRLPYEHANRVVLGVPDVHSRKPNLSGLFADVVPHGYQGLEVFARNLTSGWWAWGDQALWFQRHPHWR